MSTPGWISRCFHSEAAPAPAPSGLFEKLNNRRAFQLVSCPATLKEVRFNSSGQTSISLIHEGTNYTINLIPTSEAQKKNTLEVTSPTDAKFHFESSEQPGIGLLWPVLKLNLTTNADVLITVRFNECGEINERLCSPIEIRKAQTIIINKPSLNYKEVRYLASSFHQVETIKVLENLPEIDFRVMFRFKNFHIKNEIGFSLDNLAHSRAEVVEIRKSNLKTSDLNRFLNGWIHGQNRSLRQLTVGGVSHDEQLLSNIEIIGWDDDILVLRSKLPNDVCLRLASGKNIRSNYGAVATVTYTNDQEFCFYIWNNSGLDD